MSNNPKPFAIRGEPTGCGLRLSSSPIALSPFTSPKRVPWRSSSSRSKIACLFSRILSANATCRRQELLSGRFRVGSAWDSSSQFETGIASSVGCFYLENQQWVSRTDCPAMCATNTALQPCNSTAAVTTTRLISDDFNELPLHRNAR